ncbi:MAG: helix-turn-helix domain-containing protein [Nostoc sp.]|uniref:helix-turn-helix domain-containing protein n=1 Tax=Nostoc sp. TaxID=1180 RepID=UPI002FF48448
MNNFLLEQQQKLERIAILIEFIHSHPESRELKRAMAVKMALEVESYSKINKLLGINKSCITNWNSFSGKIA